MSSRYYLNKHRIVEAITTNHICQEGFAKDIGLSRSHWSQVLNGRVPATPKVRRALLDSTVLRGIPESELWHRENALEMAA